MSEEAASTLKQRVKDLCMLVYTEQLILEHTKPEERLHQMLAMSAEDLLQYLERAVVKLLQASGTEYKRYQRALQKLEAEVRRHYNVRTTQTQEQLRVYLDTMEGSLEKSELNSEKLKATEDRLHSVDEENARLRDQLAKVRAIQLTEGNRAEVEALQQQLERAKGSAKELEVRCHQLETALEKTKARDLHLDSRQHEVDYLRKRYDDKCSEMTSMAKRYNSLATLKHKAAQSQIKDASTKESRDTTPRLTIPAMNTKSRVFKSIKSKESAFKEQMVRSKSTERLSGRYNPSPIKARTSLVSPVRM
jgi:predicted RNase H-like nuclease (RuvC/YqgF family)